MDIGESSGFLFLVRLLTSYGIAFGRVLSCSLFFFAIFFFLLFLVFLVFLYYFFFFRFPFFSFLDGSGSSSVVSQCSLFLLMPFAFVLARLRDFSRIALDIGDSVDFLFLCRLLITYVIASDIVPFLSAD